MSGTFAGIRLWRGARPLIRLDETFCGFDIGGRHVFRSEFRLPLSNCGRVDGPLFTLIAV